MTNTVTPKIDMAQTNIWFDPAGISKKGTPVKFSLTQTDKPTTAYKGDGVIRRTKACLALFEDQACTPDKALIFCENKLQVKNKQLDDGFQCYALGNAEEAVDLFLELDALETSELKSGVENKDLIKVNPSAQTTVTIKAASVAQPQIILKTGDNRVLAGGASTQIILKMIQPTGKNYDGSGKLSLSPKTTGELEIYKGPDDRPENKLNPNDITLSAADLTNGGIPLYLKGIKPGAGTLTLELAQPKTDPDQWVIDPPVNQALTILQLHTVKPVIKTIKPGPVWFPESGGSDSIPQITLSLDPAEPEVPYAGAGILKQSVSFLKVYTDAQLTAPLDFIANEAVIPAKSIRGKGMTLYLNGSASGKAGLKFTLQPTDQYDLKVENNNDEKNTLQLDIRQANFVRPSVLATEPILWLAPDWKKAPLTILEFDLLETNRDENPFDGTIGFSRSHTDLKLYSSRECKPGEEVFDEFKKTADIGKQLPENLYYAKWTGMDMPTGPVFMAMTLLPSGTRGIRVASDKVQKTLEVVPVNQVTPRIETAYDLIPKNCRTFDDKIRTSPVQARIYAEQTNPDFSYTGDAVLKRSNFNVRIFTDDTCTSELPFDDSNTSIIPNKILLDDKRTYYLVGGEPGATSLSLELKGSVRPSQFLGDPVKKEMAVIRLSLEVWHDELPGKPAPMSDERKQAQGRFLHIQNAKKDFGRSKLVIKTDTSDWPKTADNHRVLLTVTATGDELIVYNAVDGDTVKAKNGQPLALNKGDFSAGDPEFWAQGEKISAAPRDIRVSLGLDRTDDNFTGAQPLLNGDWASMTVVRIVSVNPAGPDWKQFVNLPPDRATAHNENLKDQQAGRHILVTAEVSPPFQGMGIDFILAPDTEAGGVKADVPDSLKYDDKHVSAVTDATGKASARIKLSRHGGDAFRSVAFLCDDATKGKTLGINAPDPLKSGTIRIWQKVFYNIYFMKRHGAGTSYTGNYKDRFSVADLTNTLEDGFLRIEQKNAVNTEIVNNVPVLYDKSADGPEDLTWGNSTFPAKEDRTFNLAFVETLGDKVMEKNFTITALAGEQVEKEINNKLYDLSSRDKYLKAGSGKLKKKGGGWQTNIPDDKITLEDCQENFKISVDLTGIGRGGNDLASLKINMTLKEVDESCGFSLRANTFTAVRYAEQKGVHAANEVFSTAVHEVGHYLGLTAKKIPDAAQTGNKLWYYGRSGKTQYWKQDGLNPLTLETDNSKAIGTGNHCMCGYADYADLKSHLGQKAGCLMYHATVSPPVITLCDTCKKALKARDFSLTKSDAQADY